MGQDQKSPIHFDPDDDGHRFFAGLINGLIYAARARVRAVLGMEILQMSEKTPHSAGAMDGGKHTPTPWKTHSAPDGRVQIAIVRPGFIGYIATMFKSLDDSDQANAAFIVRAVNSHAKLVEALKLARVYVQSEVNCNEQGMDDLYDIDAALKLAEGQS